MSRLVDKIEVLHVSELKPYARNARTHPPEQVEQLAESIRRFGFNNPILIDEDGIIVAGHGRLEGAKAAGLTHVPVIRVGHMTEAERRAYIIADNKIALNAGWDLKILSDELIDLDTGEIDLTVTGFSDDELADILASVRPPPERGSDADDIPEAALEPKVRTGEIYILGDHRLMCGDSTSIDAVEKLMDGKKADMVFTSPPYNANTKAGDGDIFNGKKSKKLYAEGYSDNLKSDSYVKFAKDVLEMCFLVTDGFIFWNVSYNANSRFEYIMQIADRLPFLIEQICWKKTSTIPFKGSLMRDWEPVYVFSTNKLSLGISEVVSNHWVISNQNAQQENHKACFPVELPSKGISLVKSKTGIVFEPFGGSGSTLIACEKTHRQCFMMEMDPIYCGVILDRYQDFTKRQAIRESDNKLWDEIRAE